MKAYYNDFEQFPCHVIEENIGRGRLPAGRVDCRAIEDVDAAELVGRYRQFHLFAGIGGAAYACRLAGIPDDFSIGTMGFPCPSFSCAGQGAAFDDPRGMLFFFGCRFFSVVRPRWIVLENVPGLRTAGRAKDVDGIGAIETILATLEIIGYTALPPVVVGADDVGAPHKRKRVWIVARSNESLADAEHGRLQERVKGVGRETRNAADGLRSAGYERGLEHAKSFAEREPADEAYSFANRREARPELGSGCSSLGNATGERTRRIPTGQGAERQRTPDPDGTSQQLADAQHNAGSAERGIKSRQWPEKGPKQIPVSGGSGELVDANYSGCEERCSAVAIPSQLATAECCSRWPARPGQPQHEWEEPRTIAIEEIERALGGATDGLSERLVRHIQGLSGWPYVKSLEWARRNRGRIEGRLRRESLKGYGNAWCPQTAAVILTWILQEDELR